jgi:hypothetical protein
MKKVINLIIAIVSLSILTYYTYQTYLNAKKLENVNKAYYEAQTDIGDLIKRKFSSILSTLSLGAIESKDSKEAKLNELKAKQIVLKEQTKKDIIILASISAGIVLLYFVLDLATYTLLLGLSSLITLLFGVFTPILMIVIHKYVDYLGDIVLSYESKTIVGTIEHLYKSQNYPVAITILLFSIITPLLKTLTMITIALLKEFHLARKLSNIFKHLAKWSMLDVFVVSLLLVYLSVGSSQNSYSEIENGLYIFLIYVILSILTSLAVERLLNKKDNYSNE